MFNISKRERDAMLADHFDSLCNRPTLTDGKNRPTLTDDSSVSENKIEQELDRSHQ